MDPMGDDARLTLGQRLMLGLVIAPGSLLMALGTLVDPLATGMIENAAEAVVNWAYVLVLAGVGAGTLSMAVMGRVPGGRR